MTEDGEFAKLDLGRIQIWIERHQQAGRTSDPKYARLLAERARRTGAGLDVEVTLRRLQEAARCREFVTYGEVAEANRMSWKQARHRMNGDGGHLDQIVDICHARGLPHFTSLCVNQAGRSDGTLADTALSGFIKALRRTGRDILDEEMEAALKSEQAACFAWGERNDG
ncbi:MAG: hypothetical protein LCH56_03425 [Proteobacteria bacterium]|nr:hypothetical protein [Pseudomonadota bacterium]